MDTCNKNTENSIKSTATNSIYTDSHMVTDDHNDELIHSNQNIDQANDDQLTNTAPCMLTTKDNPYNPFTQFMKWFMFDCEKGYYTCSKLARLTKTNDAMTQEEENIEIERAVDRLIELDFEGNYIKVQRNPNDKQTDDGTL